MQRLSVMQDYDKKDVVVNEKNGLSVKTTPGGHCKSSGVVYAIHCKKCKMLYIGETGKTISERYGGHKYDIKKRPDNCDLAKHCCNSKHDLEKDLELTIMSMASKTKTNAKELKISIFANYKL